MIGGLNEHRISGPWSLWDIMQRFRASSFATVIGGLHRAATVVGSAGLESAEERAMVLEIVTGASPSLDELPLRRSVRSQFARLVSSIQTADGNEVKIRIAEFSNSLLDDLAQAWFLMIPEDKRERYEQRRPAFGDAVAERFPDAAKDISAASRCLALDEWTACVFHLMRVLEHGLRALADDVGLSSDAMARENWKNVIDQIEKTIRQLESAPKSAERTRRTQGLAAAVVQFRYFKDAWRNHVSHAHASYDDREATTIWTHVEAFMIQLAGLLPEQSP